MRKGKKQKAILNGRIKEYEQLISRDASKASEFTKPGSNKKRA